MTNSFGLRFSFRLLTLDGRGERPDWLELIETQRLNNQPLLPSSAVEACPIVESMAKGSKD